MADLGTDRGEVEAGALSHRKGVDIGAQRHSVCRLPRPDVGDQAGAVESVVPDAGGREALRDDGRGAELVAAQFRVLMEVSPNGDEVRAVRLDGAAELGDGVEGHCVFDGSAPPGRLRQVGPARWP